MWWEHVAEAVNVVADEGTESKVGARSKGPFLVIYFPSARLRPVLMVPQSLKVVAPAGKLVGIT